MELNTKQTDKTPKKVTLDELIKRAATKKDDKKATKKLEVQSLGGYITIEKPDKALCLDSFDMEDSNESDKYIVYNCVIEPNLKSQELQKAYNPKRPPDIVDMIFEPGEIAAISKECLEMAGYINSVKVVQDIKN